MAYPVNPVVPKSILRETTIVVTVLEQLVPPAIYPSMVKRQEDKYTDHRLSDIFSTAVRMAFMFSSILAIDTAWF